MPDEDMFILNIQQQQVELKIYHEQIGLIQLIVGIHWFFMYLYFIMFKIMLNYQHMLLMRFVIIHIHDLLLEERLIKKLHEKMKNTVVVSL